MMVEVSLLYTFLLYLFNLLNLAKRFAKKLVRVVTERYIKSGIFFIAVVELFSDTIWFIYFLQFLKTIDIIKLLLLYKLYKFH